MGDESLTAAMPSLRASRDRLWHDRNFLRFWIGQTASQLGAQSSQLTVPLVAVVALGAGSAQVGLLRAVQQVPVLLIALFVGVWVDRWRGRRLLIAADFGRALVLAAVPVAYILGLLGIPLLYAVGFLVGVLTVFFDVAYQAYLLRLVPRDQLVQGNSMLESSRSAAQIGGPALGGGLVSLLTAPVAVVASSAFFVVSFFAMSRVDRPEVKVERAGQREGLIGQIRTGVRVVLHDPSLRTVAIISGVYNFGFAAFSTVYLLFLTRQLELPNVAVGLCLAAFGPGSLVGSLLAATLPRRFTYGVVLVAAATIADLVALGAAAVHGSGVLTVVLLVTINVVFGAFTQTVNIGVTAVRQAITPDLVQGRVSATIRFCGLGLAPLGSLAGGFLGAVVDLRMGVLLAAASLCLSPLFMVFSPLARLGVHLPKARSGDGTGVGRSPTSTT